MNTIAAFGNDRVLAVSVLRERLIGVFGQAKYPFRKAIGSIGGSVTNGLIDINNGVATLLV